MIFVPSASLSGVGLTIQNIAIRETSIESTTTSILPVAGDHDEFNYYAEELPGPIFIMNVSANRTNDIVGFANAPVIDKTVYVENAGSAVMSDMKLKINDASEFFYTTPATAGNYILQRIGTKLRQA